MSEARRAYATARLHARHAARPGAASWSALEASRDPAHYLEALRAARGLRVPAGDLAADVDARERWLRGAWREACGEVASWYDGWAPALRWLAPLPDLDALERLRDGGRPPPWTRDDPWLGPLAAAAPDARTACVARGPYAPLTLAWATGAPLAPAWYRTWRETWPATDARTRRELATLERAVRAAAALDVRARRGALEAAAERAFRRGSGTLAAAVASLAVFALQLERVRGGLASRELPLAATGAAGPSADAPS